MEEDKILILQYAFILFMMSIVGRVIWEIVMITPYEWFNLSPNGLVDGEEEKIPHRRHKKTLVWERKQTEVFLLYSEKKKCSLKETSFWERVPKEEIKRLEALTQNTES